MAEKGESKKIESYFTRSVEERTIFVHREVDVVTCFCANFYQGGYEHQCCVTLNNTRIKIQACRPNCSICIQERKRKDFLERRFDVDEDNYVVCAQCRIKLSQDGVVCDRCFCIKCEKELDGDECNTCT